MPPLPLITPFWLHLNSNRCTGLASSTVRTTTPDATDPACTLGTIPSAACSSHAPHAAIPGTTSCTASGTTPALWLSPGCWGPTSNHYPAPVQLYLISYPLGPWPPYQQYYAGPHGHGEEDSETAKPD